MSDAPTVPIGSLRASPSVPTEGHEAAVLAIEQIVRDAMNDEWAEICSDTGCFPEDIRRVGKGPLRIEYRPRHWTDAIAANVAHRLSPMIAATQQATGEGERATLIDDLMTAVVEAAQTGSFDAEVLRRARVFLSTQQAVSPPEGVWRPIETALKSTSHDVQHGKFVTGVYLLGFIPDNAGLDRQSGIDTIWWEPNENDGAGAWFGPGAEPCNPTHWMPLPPAPDAIGEEKGAGE